MGRSPVALAVADMGLDHVAATPLTGSVRLEGYAAVGGVEGGGKAPLTLVWRATGEPAADYGLALSVTDASGDLVGTARYDEIAPGFASSRWREGDAVRGWYDVPLDGRALAGSGTLAVELLDAGGRPMSAGAQRVTLPLEITGPVRIFEPPEDAGDPVGADLGGRVTLLSAVLPSSPIAAGSVVPITLTWRAEQLLDVPYTVFVHLVAEDGATVVAQVDGQPVGGRRPTTSWLEGEIIVARQDLAVPSQPSQTRLARKPRAEQTS